MSSPDTPAGGDFVQSLARGLAVIRAFDAEHPRMSLSEVAAQAEISPAAARRFLHTLEALGYVRADGRQFALTPRVLELGFSYLSALSLPEVVQPHLERLSAEVGESVSAAVLDGTDVRYVARVATRQIMRVNIQVGTRFPAHATSMGHVLLAALPDARVRELYPDGRLERVTPATLPDVDALLAELARVREAGWALVDGQLEPGLRSLAVPLVGRGGEVVAAMNVSTSAMRDSVDRLREFHVPAALAAAAAIAADLRLAP